MNINRNDGTVITWNGSFDGPEQILDALGQSTGFSNFTACIEVNGEPRDVSVRVPDPLVSRLGEALTERCAARWFENHCEDHSKKIPEHQEHWTLRAENLLRYQAEPAAKFLFTVEIPVKGLDEPEHHTVEAYDKLNAIPMAKNRLGKSASYDWNQARVVSVDPIE